MLHVQAKAVKSPVLQELLMVNCTVVLTGLYLTFSILGAMSLAEVENMAALQSFTLGGSGSMFPHKILAILGVLRCIPVHSEAYREAHRASWEETHHHHQCLLSYWNTGNHLHRLGFIFIIDLLSMPIPCMHKPMHACPTHVRKADWLCDSTPMHSHHDS